MELSIFTTEGEDSGSKADLADSIFAIEPNESLIYEDVRRYMANQRQGTASTKERGQVRGGGRKAYRQKGTGQARRGSIRSPLLKGGGTVFGPKPRDYSYRMSKKSRRLARKSALALKANEDKLKVIEKLEFEEPKTSKLVDILGSLDIKDSKVLILTEQTNTLLYKSSRNIPNVDVLEANKLTTYQTLDADVIVIESGAVDVLQNSIEPSEETAA